MSSLYNRASPQQRRILRIVEGAVKNALDAHPDQMVRPNFARSVAKRAAGTLTAAWPEVLAAVIEPSDGGADSHRIGTPGNGSQVSEGQDGTPALSRRRRSAHAERRSAVAALKALRWDIGVLTMVAKRAGYLDERTEALEDTLRLVGFYLKRLGA